MDEMKEDRVWVLCRGGGIENVSILRSESKDGEGEGVWTFINSVLCSLPSFSTDGGTDST